MYWFYLQWIYSASQVFPCLSWNPKFHCHMHNSRHFTLSWPRCEFIERLTPSRSIFADILLRPTPGFPMYYVPRFFDRNLVFISHLNTCVLNFSPSHHSWYTLPFVEEYKSRRSWLCNSVVSHIQSVSFPQSKRAVYILLWVQCWIRSCYSKITFLGKEEFVLTWTHLLRAVTLYVPKAQVSLHDYRNILSYTTTVHLSVPPLQCFIRACTLSITT
jgi:hypothetical protein